MVFFFRVVHDFRSGCDHPCDDTDYSFEKADFFLGLVLDSEDAKRRCHLGMKVSAEVDGWV